MPQVSFRASRFCRVVLGFPSLACLLCAQPVPDLLPTPSCSSTANCNVRGTAALKAGKLKAAVANFIEELSDAEDQENEADVVLAFNKLSVAYRRQHDFLQARFWAQQALDLDPKSPTAIHNLGVIKAYLRSFHWPASPNGAYALYRLRLMG
jgi:tetratricopeptide (TPR) repeat protein